MRVAVLGGSFNPPHIGHFALAEAVHVELGFEEVVLVPTFISPLKDRESFASADDRMEMLLQASSGSAFLSVCDCELRRGGVSYTIDTLRHIIESRGARLDGKPALVLGLDWVSSFCKWRQAEEIVAIADIILARRPGFSAALEVTRREAGGDSARASVLFPQMRERASVIFADNIELAISSSDIRKRIAEGKSWRYLVPEAVGNYIVENKLYA